MSVGCGIGPISAPGLRDQLLVKWDIGAQTKPKDFSESAQQAWNSGHKPSMSLCAAPTVCQASQGRHSQCPRGFGLSCPLCIISLNTGHLRLCVVDFCIPWKQHPSAAGSPIQVRQWHSKDPSRQKAAILEGSLQQVYPPTQVPPKACSVLAGRVQWSLVSGEDWGTDRAQGLS